MNKRISAVLIVALAPQLAVAGKLSFAKTRANEAPPKAALQAPPPPETNAPQTDDTSVSEAAKALYTTQNWTYHGKNGPQYWANLHRDYRNCSGDNQSPIDLNRFTESVLRPIEFHYQPETAALLHNGHTVQLNYRQPKYIRAEGMKFNLTQLHFHSPSENHINGKSYPLEAHFMHQNDNGELAVVALLFELGAENPALARNMRELPSQEGQKLTLTSPMSPDELLPDSRDYYRYNGSLTTPPCTEGVRWFVFKHPATASSAQLQAMRAALGRSNNRPLQALKARVVLK